MTTKRSRSKVLASKPASSSSSNTSSKKTKPRDEPSTLSMEELSSVVDDGVSIQQGLNESSRSAANEINEGETRFLGEPVANIEARRRWPKRYQGKKKQKLEAESKTLKDKDDSEEIIQARCHYTQAEVDGIKFDLNDDAYVKAGDGEDDFICRIVEMFKAVDGGLYFTAQWFYRPKDTVIKDLASLIDDPKRIFLSEIRDDNPLDCLIRKLKICSVPLNVDLEAKKSSLPVSDYYYDMLYLLPYSTFVDLPPEYRKDEGQSSSKTSSDVDMNISTSEIVKEVHKQQKNVMTLLDVYAGCGAMSTGLCLGANLSGLNLETKWAVDLNKHACESHKLNHPETEVRNESAEDFLSLLKEWEKLCNRFALVGNNNPEQSFEPSSEEDKLDEDSNDESDGEDNPEVFEVESILGVCYGGPNHKRKRGLYFKIRWKGYGTDEDSWEPSDGLSDCQKIMKDYIMQCYKSKTIPLPGDVDVICGGPPCQGISGFNRFRNRDNPLDDEKNKQLVVFMEIVEHLKPKFVLMENVVDLVKFAGGYLGRYALGRLVQMNYKARLGMLAAGAYGLPQFRMRVFLWGACPTEKLPPYPLPTHDVVTRGVIPVEFEMNTVGYEEGHKVDLEKKLLLEDAISDLPAVPNDENRDQMDYDAVPRTEFQQTIRLNKNESKSSCKLYDHRPLQLNADDYQRACLIPKRKGANFRDLPGVRVRSDNKVEFDPDVPRVYLESKKPLVPDYAMTFVHGSSSKPFARLWWDETVPTVVTRAEPHNQAILHPEQDRVLTIRENARLQGFPDYYRLCGPVKERYIQVGNAVAVPVARALGYVLGLSYMGLTTSSEPLFQLPQNFPVIEEIKEDGVEQLSTTND